MPGCVNFIQSTNGMRIGLRRTRHANSVREEVREVRNKNDETALDLREAPNIRKLEHQRRANAHQDPDEQAAKEDAKEDANSLEQTQDAERHGRVLVLLGRLEQHNGDGVVQDRLAEDDGVQLRLHLVRVEDGKDGDGVRRGERGADGEGFDEGDLEAVQGYACPDVQNETQHQRRDEGSGDRKGKNSSDMAEEIPLPPVSLPPSLTTLPAELT